MVRWDSGMHENWLLLGEQPKASSSETGLRGLCVQIAAP